MPKLPWLTESVISVNYINTHTISVLRLILCIDVTKKHIYRWYNLGKKYFYRKKLIYLLCNNNNANITKWPIKPLTCWVPHAQLWGLYIISFLHEMFMCNYRCAGIRIMFVCTGGEMSVYFYFGLVYIWRSFYWLKWPEIMEWQNYRNNVLFGSTKLPHVPLLSR